MVEGKYVRGPRVRQAAELGAELWPEGGSSVEEEGAGQLGRPGWGLKTPFFLSSPLLPKQRRLHGAGLPSVGHCLIQTLCTPNPPLMVDSHHLTFLLSHQSGINWKRTTKHGGLHGTNVFINIPSACRTHQLHSTEVDRL